jgi:hypothetical protein|nr:MAG: hypothetical protein [Bacteriophage sp.]DAV75236.1 MAG TPA: hypothetical protein [Caudoviricetes sp.]
MNIKKTDMEKKINIAEILKNKPEGTKLWTDMFGSVTLYVVTDACDAFQVKHHNKEPWFDKDGKLYKEGVLCIYPSKSMRDWEKFSWKKGDLLINSCGFQCIFKEWASDDYTMFNGCYSNSRDGYEDVSNAETAKFDKLDNNIAYGYVREIERKLGGILNLETLDIEKAQPEFKDGDIVTMHKENCDIVSIFSRLKTEGSFYYYAFHAIQTNNTGVMDCYTTLPRAWTFFEGKMNFATDSEKQQLFDALAKEGKAWDAEKKQIVDLKPKVELKPFDNVLVRHQKTEEWRANIFSHTDKTDEYHDYVCVNGRWEFCIPYEGNESLLGTTKDVEVSYGRSF